MLLPRQVRFAASPPAIYAALFLYLCLPGGHTSAQEVRQNASLSAPQNSILSNASITPAHSPRHEWFLYDVNQLASRDFAGRKPGSPGGLKTTEYLTRRFQAVGLQPLPGAKSYLQTVALTEFTSEGGLRVSGVAVNNLEHKTDGADVVAWTSSRKALQRLTGRPVFVGYGIDAPEYQWDDYRDVDVRGRIVVILLGEPPAPRTHQAGRRQESQPVPFKGRLLTRHARWDEKLALAARKGAAAAILLHDPQVAGYPFPVVRNTFKKTRINLRDAARARPEPPVSFWISGTASKHILASTEITLASLTAAAQSGTDIELPLELSIELQSQWRDFDSHNVVGHIPPAHGIVQEQSVVLTAHWDHLGQEGGPTGAWYPGAADNASGVAQLLDIANQLRERRTARSLIFAALTAEESGLLGAREFVAQQINSAQPPVAAINLDIANIFGMSRDVEIIGLGLTTLDELLHTRATSMKRSISDDYAPLQGRLFRSDQYEFIRQGIPAVWLRGGQQAIGEQPGNLRKAIRKYSREGYHLPGDSVQPWWSVPAALADADLVAAILSDIASAPEDPVFR